jgi:RNA polymerase sigma factor (TIGR02999 family)
MPEDAGDVTGLLLAWGNGDERALEQLMPLVYGELKNQARRLMQGERAGHTLQPSALVNEAYLRLVDITRVRWQDRAHFFAMAARLMRRVLVDHARAQKSSKRGGGVHPIELDEQTVFDHRQPDVSDVDAALSALAAIDSRKAQVVEMRFFAGLTVAETAAALGVSAETVARDWAFARVWLLHHLDGPRRDL